MSLRVPSPLVDAGWLQARLGDPGLKIFDCTVAGKPNGDGTYSFVPQYDAWEECHIPGSVFVNIPEQLSDRNSAVGLMMPAPEDFAATMQELGVGDDSCVVLYDSGNHAWAARVWWMLRVCGFDNAAVLDGGIRRWKAENRPLAAGPYTHAPADRLTLEPRPHLMVSKEEVMSVIGDDSVVLLNSLPRPFFTGEVAPYGRAGRIPGSRNLSCESIVDDASFGYLDPGVLRQMATDSGALEGERVITYCGGGIAASSTALILTLLGVRNVSLYDGSLSEWCRDPELPLETG